MAEASTSSQPARTKVSNDAFLRPPQVRPKRRNTIGTATPIHPFPYDDIYAEGELANEIQQQQEQLIRERQTKRAKAQQQEAASKDPEKPLVGNWVKEGHQNYVLMYNMLTGIRIAVRSNPAVRFPYLVILIL
jgi:1-phosphatidylinositol-4-phosphate 5-kinase